MQSITISKTGMWILAVLLSNILFAQEISLSPPVLIPSDTQFVKMLDVKMLVPESSIVYYTLNGCEPTNITGIYYFPNSRIRIKESCTLKVVAFPKTSYSEYKQSKSIEAHYLRKTNCPLVFPLIQNFHDSLKIQILVQESDCVINYTTDGSLPTINSLQYTSTGVGDGPVFIIHQTTKVNAIATKNDCSVSDLFTWTFDKVN